MPEKFLTSKKLQDLQGNLTQLLQKVFQKAFVLFLVANSKIEGHEGQASLLVANLLEIKRISMDGKNISQIVNNTKNCWAIDYDFKTGMLYWSDLNADRIYR